MYLIILLWLLGIWLVYRGVSYGLSANRRLDFTPQYYSWDQLRRFERSQIKETLITSLLCFSGLLLIFAAILLLSQISAT